MQSILNRVTSGHVSQAPQSITGSMKSTVSGEQRLTVLLVHAADHSREEQSISIMPVAQHREPNPNLDDTNTEVQSFLQLQQNLLRWHSCTLSQIGLSPLCSKIYSLCFWHFPNFLPIMLIFMLSRYALCWQFIIIIVYCNSCIQMIMIEYIVSYKSNCNIKAL